MATLPAASPSSRAEDEFTLLDFVVVVARRWWLVIAFSLLGILAASLYLGSATYRYTAELRVSPVEAQGGGLLGRLGGLASVAGLDLPQGEDASPFNLYLEAIYSPEVALQLSDRRELLRGAFETEWDGRRFREPSSPLKGLINASKSTLGVPRYPYRAPDATRLDDWIDDNVKVVKDNKAVLVVITLEHRDPDFSSNFLEALHTTTDRVIRRKTLDRTGGTIAYLQRQLGRVLLAEHREALAEALGEQERSRMMASVNVPFAAERFGIVKVSTRPTSPKPVVSLLFGAAAGFALGVVAAVIFHFLRGRRRRAADDTAYEA